MRFLTLTLAMALTASSCLPHRYHGRLDPPSAFNHRDKRSRQPNAAGIPVAVPAPAPPLPVPLPQPTSSPCMCDPPSLAAAGDPGGIKPINKRSTPPNLADAEHYDYDTASDLPSMPAVSQGACICAPTAVASACPTAQGSAAVAVHSTTTHTTTQTSIISPTSAPLLVSTVFETIRQVIAVQQVQQTVHVISTVLQPLPPPRSPSPSPSPSPAPAPKILLQVDSGISIIRHGTNGKTEQIQAEEEGFQVEFEPLKAGMGEPTFTASWGQGAELTVMDVRPLILG